MKIWTVDAFTDKPFAGNPAAITIVDEFPSNDMCQKIAAEMNLSETAFLKPMGPDHFHIRWFTPLTEVELCGHGTLAAAHILFQEKIVKGDKINFDSLYGPLYVNREGSSVFLDFPLIKMENNPFPLLSLKKLLELKSLTAAFHSHDTVIAELSDENELRSLNLDPEKVKQIEHNTVIITTRGKAPYDFVSRVYAPREGINEDPVTGSAHCLLVDYWQQKLGKSEFLAYQASPRGGILGLQIIGDRVHLKGQAVTILKGTLRV
jgi:predicted PhzF superfamily epimerase YddE/YHI9